jgi:hypothetical protein
LVYDIQATERLIAAYRNAVRVGISIEESVEDHRGEISGRSRVILNFVEVGSVIIAALERRLGVMRSNLEALGVQA